MRVPNRSNLSQAEIVAIYNARKKERNRRLARYDEAIRLLRELATQPTDPQRWREKAHEARAFLAAEPKEGKVAG